MKLSRTITASAFALGLSTALAGSALAANLDGTPDADRLEGTPQADRISVYGGDDRVWSVGGRDEVYGGWGNDRLELGTGNDQTYAGHGHDTVFGGPGDDVIYGGEGSDYLWGGPGADFMWGGNTMYGGGGPDTIKPNSLLGPDWVSAGDGDDLIEIVAGGRYEPERDVIRCGHGFDRVTYSTRIDDLDKLVGCEQVRVE